VSKAVILACNKADYLIRLLINPVAVEKLFRPKIEVAHDGHFLDPSVMPYEFYRAMSEGSRFRNCHLRSIPPVRNALPSPKTRDDLVTPYAFPFTTQSQSLTSLGRKDAVLT
jgi:hypothetical protein